MANRRSARKSTHRTAPSPDSALGSFGDQTALTSFGDQTALSSFGDQTALSSFGDEKALGLPTSRAVARLGSQQRVAFDRLVQVATDLQRLERDLGGRVADARSHGVSWAVIGQAVGTTGEAARQRWGSTVAPPASSAGPANS